MRQISQRERNILCFKHNFWAV